MSSRFAAGTLLALGVLGFASAAAAASDFVKSHGHFLVGAAKPQPIFQLSTAFQPKVGVEDARVEADIVKVKMRIGKAFGLNENVALVTDFGLGIRNYEFSKIGGVADFDETLYEIALKLGLNWFISDRLMVAVAFRPGIFSDLDESLDGDDIQYQGNALGIYQWGDHWFVKLGVAVNQDFDQTRVIPLGGFSWVPSDQFRVDILLPQSASLTWRPWDARPLSIVPGVYLEGQQFHVQNTFGDGDIQIQDVRLDVTCSYEFADAYLVSLTGGMNFRGKYEVEGDGGFQADVDQEPSAYLALSMGVKF